MEELLLNRGVCINNDRLYIHIRITSKAVQTANTLLKGIGIPRNIKMNDLSCILEVSPLATSFVADNHTAFRVILESIHAVFQLFALHVIAESYGMNAHIRIPCIEQLQELHEGSVMSREHDQFTAFIVKDICLLINIVHGGHQAALNQIRIFVKSYID